MATVDVNEIDDDEFDDDEIWMMICRTASTRDGVTFEDARAYP
ncbi:hypothetical protein [Bradyrhizobium lablabi]|nr:hypothetical protein [Bradyrhizobium lablabi]